MKTTIQFLDEAKRILGDVSDYRLAKVIGVNQSTMSHYRQGTRVIDDYAGAKIAEILQIDSMIVISAANAEREKTEERRTFWSEKYNALILMTQKPHQQGGALPRTAYSLYIM